MALRSVNRAGRKAQTIQLPAPTGGWNTRDALAVMPITDAQEIVNLFPTPSSIEIRQGFDVQATITNGGNDVITAQGFVRYGESSLWAVGRIEGTLNSVIHDIVAGTAVTFPYLSTPPYPPSYVQFANTGGTYVCALFPAGSGTRYYTYDGASWVSQGASVSGSADFFKIASYQNRLWFTKLGQLNAYYLDSLAIIGTPTAFPLGGIATRGGSLSHIGTWTLDGGVGGTDDLIVFFTSAGQAIIYQGIDPSSAASWRLVGVFDISPLIGEPFKYGADLLVPCEDGLYSMTQVLRGNSTSEFAVSDKIRTAWQAAALVASGSGGTRCVYSPKLNMIVVNFTTGGVVASGPQTSVWFVMNTITKSWTKYTGLDAWAIDVLDGDIYFSNVTSGSSGTLTIYKFGSDNNDNGAAITGYCRQAYSYLGTPGVMKCITGILPSWAQNGAYTVGFAADWDFTDRVSTSTTSTNEKLRASGAYRPLLSYPVTGDAISVFAEMKSGTATGTTEYCRWFNTTLLAIPGGVV